MKRCIAVLMTMVVAVLCCSAAFAEGQFALRCGILFGDSQTGVAARETELTRIEEERLAYEGTLWGYDSAQVVYLFDDNGLLTELNESFGKSTRDEETTKAVYADIRAQLRALYGEPLQTEGSTPAHPIAGMGYKAMVLFVYTIGALDGCEGECYDYSEWVVDCDGYHVKIDLTAYYVKNNNNGTESYGVGLSFKKFTDADLEAAGK